MNLGIVITRSDHAAVATGLLSAAAARDWKLRCFLTDSGVKCLENPDFKRLCDTHTFWLALCEMSVERYHMDVHALQNAFPDLIVGGQYQDAELVKNSDHVLVF